MSGRRVESMKARIIKLAVEHGIVCALTSFVVIETRSGERRANGQPETRVVPVSKPAGWAMLDAQIGAAGLAPARAATPAGAVGGGAALPPPAPPMMQRAMAPSPGKGGGILSKVADALSGVAAKKAANGRFRRRQEAAADDVGESAESLAAPAEQPADPLTALLSRQLASGLWDERDSTADDEVRRARATARALLDLADLGVTSSHALHGAQVKKAIEALLALAPQVAQRDHKVAELALGVAWLVSSGRRTRRQIEDEVARLAVTLRVWLADEQALRAHLSQLSS